MATHKLKLQDHESSLSIRLSGGEGVLFRGGEWGFSERGGGFMRGVHKLLSTFSDSFCVCFEF